MCCPWLHYGTGYLRVSGATNLRRPVAVFRLQGAMQRLAAQEDSVFPLPYPSSRCAKRRWRCDPRTTSSRLATFDVGFSGLGDGHLRAEQSGQRVHRGVAGGARTWATMGLKTAFAPRCRPSPGTMSTRTMTKSKTSANYVNSVLAKSEVKKAGYDEAIMLDTEGYVAEASGENIFIVRHGEIKTTPLTSILPGITRESIITLARDKGYQVVEERFTRDEIYIADEAFFTGTAAELTPIREVDDSSGRRRPARAGDRRYSKYFFDVIKAGPRKKIRQLALSVVSLAWLYVSLHFTACFALKLHRWLSPTIRPCG